MEGTNDSVLTVDCVDQAGLRSLLTLLWDTGHEILRLTSAPATVRRPT